MATCTSSLGDWLSESSAAEVLAVVAEAELAERRAGLVKLEAALAWCVLHPATAASGVAVWGDAGLPGMSDCEESLGGAGCPLVAWLAPEPFAAALGVSTFAGMQLLADALDLAYRLPRTWARVRALAVAPWRGRRMAQATHGLSQRAAAHVDAALVDRIDSCGGVAIDRAVAHAAAVFDPAPVATAEESATASWDVRLRTRDDGGFAGTSHLEAIGDTLDLARFYDLVCDQAAHLGRLGDTDPLGVRKAKALGVIADAQTRLDLTGSTSRTGDEPSEPVRRPSLSKTRAYVHVQLADLLDPLSSTGTGGGVGEVERLGPVTLAKIREWLGSTRATIVPVLHPDTPDEPRGSRAQAVDAHDPPEWMRESVILRDRHCVFPWCRVEARGCDLDHIDPYVPPDEGGPPGQTRPINLAPLCRRHHHAKTARRWRYQRDPDGTYTWHGPYGVAYLVTPHGTHELTHA